MTTKLNKPTQLENMPLSILISDGSTRKKLTNTLQDTGFVIISSNNFHDLQAQAISAPTQAIILDYENGEVYKNQKNNNIENVASFGTEVIILAEDNQLEKAYDLARTLNGYLLAQPVQIHELILSLERMFTTNELKHKLNRYEISETSDERFGRMIVKSPEMKDVVRLAKVLAKRKDDILIIGSVGTGRELLAKTIHEASDRKAAPFYSINCNSFAGDDLAMELFGRGEPGTDSADDEKTFLEMAEGGTILLKEIAEITPNIQGKLLNLLENGTYTRVGSRTVHNADVRIIASTSKALNEKVAKGDFSEDLYFRLNRFTLHLPDLRRRVEDIPVLVREISQRLAKEKNVESLKFTESALKLLMDYSWPGNIRELENVLDFAMLIAEDGPIDSQHLPKQFHDNVGSIFLGYEVDDLPPMSEIERRYIMRVMEATQNNKVKAAEILDINRATLHRKLQIYERKKIAKLG